MYFTEACPIALFCIALPWLIMITVRYIKVNNLFKTSMCLLITSTFILFSNSVLGVIIYKRPFELVAFNLKNWSNYYISGNVIIITVIVCIAMSVLFAVGGIILTLKSKSHKIETTSN